MAVLLFQKSIPTSPPASDMRLSMQDWPSLDPTLAARLNNLIDRFLKLAAKSSGLAAFALDMGDLILKNLGA